MKSNLITSFSDYLNEDKFYKGHKALANDIFLNNNPDNYWELIKHINVYVDDDTFEQNPIELVDVTKIVPTQKFIDKYNIEKVKDIKLRDNTGAYLVKYNELYYVIDGHHRIAKHILDGASRVKAFVQTI